MAKKNLPESNIESDLNSRGYLNSLVNEMNTVRAEFYNTLSSGPLFDCTTSTASTSAKYVGDSERALRMIVDQLYELRVDIVGEMSPFKSISHLVKVLDDMQCPDNDCENCKYFIKGGIDRVSRCNTNLKIAEFLVGNGHVKVLNPKK